MKNWVPICCVALLALSVAACQAVLPDEASRGVEREMYAAVRSGDDGMVARLSAPNLATPESRAQLVKIRALLPPGAPEHSKLVGWNLWSPNNGEATAMLVSEHDYGERVVLAQTNLIKFGKPERWQVQGFHVQVATDAELAVNDFGLVGKQPGQYLFLVAAVLSPLAMIAALVKVIRTKGLRRKWLWGIGAFFGVTSLQMNWATGAIVFDALTVQLLGAGAGSGLSRFDPWFITMTLPVGAALILGGLWANPARARRKDASIAAQDNF